MQNRYPTLAVLFPLVLAGVAAACGGSQPPAEPPPAPSATAEPNVAPPPPAEPAPEPSASAAAAEAPPAPAAPAWSDQKSLDDKKAFMKANVLPHMKEVFAAFDAKRFAEVDCATCHGKAAKAGTFKMPNPELPKLDKKAFAKAEKKNPKMLEFMKSQVVPEMAKLLGEQPFNPETHEGFGCGKCHVMDMEKPKPGDAKK